MTDPHQAVIELIGRRGGSMSAQPLYTTLMESGHTWNAVYGAVEALVKAGKVERGNGWLWIVQT